MTEPLTPEHLRASSALWSLRVSLGALAHREAVEARAIADERAAAADPLKSPVYGARRGLGGHSDPTSEALLVIGGPPRSNRFSDLADEVTGQLAEVAQHLPPAGHDSLTRIEAALPTMSKTAAEATWRLADRIDSRIRRLLREPQDRRFVPRVRCPWCDAVSLAMRLAPPRDLRVVECTTCDGAWTWSEMTMTRVNG
jgi:hypothetical protein